jgi:hypothetical protein
MCLLAQRAIERIGGRLWFSNLPVAWQSGDWTGLKGQTVSLRFTLQNANSYAFWLEQ